MAVDTTDLSAIYEEFLTKGISKLTDLQNDTQMEDEHLATAAAAIISAAMENSTRTLQTLKSNQLIDAQIETEKKKTLDIVSTTAVRDAQSAKDLLLKQEQIEMSVLQQATETKKTLDIVSTTAVRDAQSAKDLLLKTAQIDLIHEQEALASADYIVKNSQNMLLQQQVLTETANTALAGQKVVGRKQ
ncbi:MAG: hypothetical protein WBK67_02410 [Minisyncoccales bacterium]